MKQIAEIYGKALLEAVIVGLLVILLLLEVDDGHGNRGIFQIIGSQIRTEHTDYRDYTDFDVYRESCSKTSPVIQCKDIGLLKAGIVELTACIVAVDYRGRELPLEVRQVQAPDGTDITDAYDPDTGMIDFSDAGIYVVRVVALDDNCKNTVCSVRLPVNQ